MGSHSKWRLGIAASVASNAITLILLQFGAMLILTPREYGLYSTCYLIYAWFLSLSLSIMSESWLRATRLTQQAVPSDRFFKSAALGFSLVTGLLSGLLLSFYLRDPALTLLACIAIPGGVFRATMRFWSLHWGRTRQVLIPDLAISISLVIAFIIASSAFRVDDLGAVFWAWAASSLVGALMSLEAFHPDTGALWRWLRTYRRDYVVLVGESSIMDVSSIGIPLLMQPLLGLTGFGTYRAMSSVAAPVRLILNPLRPVIGERDPQRFGGSSNLILLTLISSLTMGLCAAASLLLISNLEIQLGALGEVSKYSAPVGLYVAANFMNHFWYLRSRTRTSGTTLLRARIWQTVCAATLPLAGAVLGLEAAMWGIGIATVMSAGVWMSIGMSTRKPPPAPS